MAPRKENKTSLILESQVFVPYITDNQHNDINIELSLKMALQIIVENSENTNTLQAIEIVTNQQNTLAKTIETIAKTEPSVTVKFVDRNSNQTDFILCSDGHLERSLLSNLKQDGFIVFNGYERSAIDFGICIVYQNTYKGKGIFLLRNVTPLGSYEVILVNNSHFLWLEKAKQCLKTEDTLYLFTQRDDGCGIVGLVKCINVEPKESASVRCVFIQERDATTFNPELDCYKEQLIKKLNVNVLRSAVWGSYRHVPVNGVKHIDVDHASNSIQTIGDLSSFEWSEASSEYKKSSPDSEYIFVYYAALNFKDVLLSTVQDFDAKNSDPTSDFTLGFEYSGISESGSRVMGISDNSSISLQVMSNPLFTWNVPDSWSLEEAASVPVIYATCYYAVIVRGQLNIGSSILIHDGASAIGLAALSIALSMSCEVYTTCGSKESEEFLLTTFPNLKSANIGSSRNIYFEQMIMRNTKGRGVDIVFNLLTINMFEASFRCVAQGGQFIEIGKIDIIRKTKMDSSLLDKNINFYGAPLDDLLTDDVEVKQNIYRLVSEGINHGIVRPIPRTVFAEDEVEDAFRFLSTGKHKGKVLIQIRNEIPSTIQSPHRTIRAKPKIYFHPDRTYIIVGCLEEFDLELTNFLIKRGARKIVLNSKRYISERYQATCLKRLSELEGVTTKISTDDTSTVDGAKSVVNLAEEIGPVGGIFNTAPILQDALFMNQTVEKFNSVFRSTIYSGANMDRVSRELCHQLDHFVVFSTVVAGRGSPGLSNYGMANSALERLCEMRRKDGLPGLAVQYGPIAEDRDKASNTLGLAPQSITSRLGALETFMLQPYTIGSAFVKEEENVFTSNGL